MSGLPRGATALARLRTSVATLVVAATLGGLVGFCWGIVDDPLWRAEAELVVTGTSRSGLDSDRLAALVSSDQVALDAAGRLGDDVPGADLLSDVTATPLDGGISVAATSEVASFAVAAANAFAETTADLAVRRERRRLRRTRDGLRDDLAEIDPASAEATELAERIGRLDDSLAQPPAVEVLESAELPTEPASDRPAPLWTLLGAIAGLVVGVGLSARRAPSRPAIETAAAAASHGLPVVSVSRSSSLPMGLEVSELLSHLSLGYRRTGPGVLAVTGAGGTERASELAAAIAMTAAFRGRKTLLVDCDVADPSQAALHGLESAPGLADYLLGRAGPQEVLRPLRGSGTGREGVAVALPAGEADGVEPLALLRSESFAALLARTIQVYDLLVLDAPALSASAEGARLCIARAEAAVVVAEAAVTDPDELQAAAGMAGTAEPAICAFLESGTAPGGGSYDSRISRPEQRV